MLEFDGAEEVKKRRQFVLEDVANWHTISAFGEEEAEVLKNSHRKMQISKMDRDIKGSWDHEVTQITKDRRDEEEVLQVVDED